jgi:hypothetical protein
VDVKKQAVESWDNITLCTIQVLIHSSRVVLLQQKVDIQSTSPGFISDVRGTCHYFFACINGPLFWGVFRCQVYCPKVYVRVCMYIYTTDYQGATILGKKQKILAMGGSFSASGNVADIALRVSSLPEPARSQVEILYVSRCCSTYYLNSSRSRTQPSQRNHALCQSSSPWRVATTGMIAEADMRAERSSWWRAGDAYIYELARLRHVF